MTKPYQKFFDPNISRKSKIIDSSLKIINNIPLPSLVEISNSGMCNRKCSFCPRSDPNYKDINEFISIELHDKIIKELSVYQYDGILVYSGFNEPLLKKDIYRDIKEARNNLPEAQIELITNGDVLNSERLSKLFIAGLSTILISVYDGEEDYKKFHHLCEQTKLKKSQYIIRKRYLAKKYDYGITMSNRSGLLKNAEHAVPAIKKSLNKPCNYPSYTFFIDYNGDVLMCSHDWGKKLVLGNMNKESFIDIWKSQKSMIARSKLIKADRNFSPCNKCDVDGGLIGNKHSEVWNKI
tara:strand:- start:340 stop:1224 length:885 start_codon:yes stop_codon:yes gene_type:complete